MALLSRVGYIFPWMSIEFDYLVDVTKLHVSDYSSVANSSLLSDHTKKLDHLQT
jgi:hypothetical protein